PVAAPEKPLTVGAGGQGTHAVPLDLEQVFGRVERFRRYRQHGEVAFHQADLRAAFVLPLRLGVALDCGARARGWAAATLCLSASSKLRMGRSCAASGAGGRPCNLASM